MFKYIAAILKTISPAQRVIALSIVLLSITLISVGPKIVSSFTQDNEELKAKVELQRTEIAVLTARVNELNTQVIDNQRQCTNEIIQKERDILSIIAEIEAEASKTIRPRQLIRNESRMPGSGNGGSGDGEVAMMRIPEPQVIEVPVTNPKMISLIKKLKKDIQKDLTEKQ
jgi:predicted RNase H-like nuclease (RuvC/YqgF family)